MKIALLTHLDPRDSKSWSGIFVQMISALERTRAEVTPFGPSCAPVHFFSRIARRGVLLPLGKNIDPNNTFLLSKCLAWIFGRRLLSTQFDVIFAPAARSSIAFLQTHIPIVYYTDITARQFRNYAENLRGLSRSAVSQTEELEKRAFAKAKSVVFASEWARQSALRDYALPEEKTAVIPMGANLDEMPSRDEITAVRSRPRAGRCSLLLIGVDWERKGGNIALDAMCILRQRGIDAQLTVVGCVPPKGVGNPHLNVIPFLSKSVPSQRDILYRLLFDSDFMILPTQREAYGIVCCEANAFGLPVIASDGGGVPVENWRNGRLLSPQASGFEFADAIQELFLDPDLYRHLAYGGRSTFEQYLNWDVWAQSMMQIFENQLSSRRFSRLLTSSVR